MSVEFKNFLKIWVPAIMLMCTLIGYGGKAINAIYGVATDIRELKSSVNQLGKDVSELKMNAYTSGKESKDRDDRQSVEIERLSIDVARLKVLARIAAIRHDNLPITDHCSFYHEALVFDEPKSKMSLN